MVLNSTLILLIKTDLHRFKNKSKFAVPRKQIYMRYEIKSKLIFFSMSIFMLMICSFVKGNSINSPFSPDIIGTQFSNTSLVNKYIELSFGDKSNNPFAIYNSFEALELAKKIKYQKGVGNLFRKCFTTINRDETFNSSHFSVLKSHV